MTEVNAGVAVAAAPQIDTSSIDARALATLLPLVEYLQASHARLEKENKRLRAKVVRQDERIAEEIDRASEYCSELHRIDDRRDVIATICAHIDEAIANQPAPAADGSSKLKNLQERLQRKTDDYDDALATVHARNGELAKVEKRLKLVSDENEALREAVKHAEDEAKKARGYEQERHEYQQQLKDLESINAHLSKQVEELQDELERAKSDLTAAASPAADADLVAAAGVLRHLDQGIALFDEDGEKSLRSLKRARAALTVSDGRESA